MNRLRSKPQVARGKATSFLRQPLTRLAITALFIFLIVRAIHPATLVKAFIGIKWNWILFAEIAAALSICVQVLVWRLLLNINDEPLRLSRLASLYLQGLLFSHVLPGTVCGDAFRLFRTSQLIGEAPAASSIIAGRTAELDATLFTGLVAVITLPAWFNFWRPAAIVLLIIGLIVLQLIIFKITLPKQLFDKAGKLVGKRFATTLAEIADAYVTYRTDKQALIWCIVLSAVSWWLLVASMICFAHAVGVQIGWNLFSVAVPLSVFTALIPISFNGVGLREAVLIWILGAAGIDASQALAIAILIDLQLIPMILFGAILWFLDHR